jgi:probable rRNA maturation factor
VSIQIVFEDIKPLKINKNSIKNSIKKLITNDLMITGDISVIVCSDLFLLEINKQYLQHDYYTDIITFNYCEGEIISGDLFISIDRVEENAKIFEIPVNHEFLRVMFHGILHLTGYNDKTEEEQRIMRQKEDFYLGEVDLGGIEK